MLKFFAIFLISAEALSQVVTSPFTIDKINLNPAATTTRRVQGVSLVYSKKQEDSTMSKSGNVYGDAQWDKEYTVDQLDLHLILKFKILNLEALLAPSQGKVKTSINLGDDASSESVSYIGNQFLLGIRPFKFLGFGFKFSNPKADYTLSTTSVINDDYDTITQIDSGTNNNKFSALGMGVILNIGNLYLGGDLSQISYSNDYLKTFSDSYDLNTDDNFSWTENGNYDFEIEKTSIGIALLTTHSRIEASIQMMDTSYDQLANTQASLDPDLNSGERISLSYEQNIGRYYFGISYSVTSGFFIDMNNLMPFFLNKDSLTDIVKTDYSVSFGLLGSKGLSIGLYALKSNETSSVKVYPEDEVETPIDKEILYLGASFSYTF